MILTQGLCGPEAGEVHEESRPWNRLWNAVGPVSRNNVDSFIHARSINSIVRHCKQIPLALMGTDFQTTSWRSWESFLLKIILEQSRTLMNEEIIWTTCWRRWELGEDTEVSHWAHLRSQVMFETILSDCTYVCDCVFLLNAQLQS